MPELASLNALRSWADRQYLKRLDEQIAEHEQEIAFLRIEREKVLQRRRDA